MGHLRGGLGFCCRKGMDGHGEMGLIGENFDPGFIGRMREDGYDESRSGSDNFEVASGDDQDVAADDGPRKKKKYHRHTPRQIQELESFFKECPHPDEKQRMELSRRLGLEGMQIKFWFQNRRTQMKTQLERHENVILRQENDKLRAENDMLKQAMTAPVCNSCGGPAVPGEISFEKNLHRIENARLKDELGRICALTNKAATIDMLSGGTGGTRDNELLVIDAEFQVLSPLVPVRQVRLIRFCKQHSEGVWAVVDVSIDASQGAANTQMFPNCRRLPSGCLIQDVDNNCSKVTWVEHSEYDESAVHHLLQPVISSGFGFGALRWLATLQRQCDCMAVLMSQDVPGENSSGITPVGKKSLLKLAQRMMNNFCAGVCASSIHEWDKLSIGNVGEDVRVMARKNINDPGEPHGVVLCAATSVWMLVTQDGCLISCGTNGRGVNGTFCRTAGQFKRWSVLPRAWNMLTVSLSFVARPLMQTRTTC
ncbi:Homeobox-leucine zipper protein HDG1 [Hibiscus syriacus]|uniref:Homeobox-leucine zipper protein HDG1 n=1 Tax=Hibiscus syriacus TaxID=106335 RepID=A0A6A3BY75_HIBSY|nr:Homeobox-leucine zipper protein HDG1 [Hibiscus syriacus]